jgi:hypothetical protein
LPLESIPTREQEKEEKEESQGKSVSGENLNFKLNALMKKIIQLWRRDCGYACGLLFCVLVCMYNLWMRISSSSDKTHVGWLTRVSAVERVENNDDKEDEDIQRYRIVTNVMLNR